MSKEDIEIIKSVIYNQNEQQMDYIDIDNITPDEECKTFITAIEHLIKAYKELEEERKLLNTEYVDNIPEGQYIGINKLQYKEYLYLKSNSIPKAKVEEILEKEELPNVIVGGRRNSKTLNYGKKLGRIELCKELLKNEGE